jgi:hypothetical protein
MMSNVKRIRIEGDLDTLALMYAPDSIDPLDGNAFGFAKDELEKGHNIPARKMDVVLKDAKLINRFLACSVVPHFGLKITFQKVSRTEKNGYNGQITYYDYVIEGEEAVGWGWFDALVAALRTFGKVKLNKCADLEAL